MITPLTYEKGKVKLIDQTKLPQKEEVIETCDYQEICKAIKKLAVRGAPAIGVAAAYGVVLGVNELTSKEKLKEQFDQIVKELKDTRPTAVNLEWALTRMREVFEKNSRKSLDQIKNLLLQEADRIKTEDVEINRRIGRQGAKLIEENDTVLTHCNAGVLATAGYGTALGVIRAAFDEGKMIQVLVDETRPLLQGARLTAWELEKEGIPYRLITDNMAGYFMSKGEVNRVVVGADRIAANGDTANKIGTYSLAVLADYHHIPFYVAAPISTIDFPIKSGNQIPIEERPPEEVTHFNGQLVTPEGTKAKNPAFDVTPNELISCIITEKGVLQKPFQNSIRNTLQ